MTTMSPTGAAVLEQQGMAHVHHRYLPIDFRGACQRFFQLSPLTEGWIVETEIWPWLYASAKAQDIPLTIISARLSEKTRSQADSWLSGTFRQALENVTVLARSEHDAQGFIALGASPASCISVGNLKYAHSANADIPSPGERLINQPYVLAASTHADEEVLLAKAWSELLSFATAEVRLVIVPRHPERGASISKQLMDAGIASNRRSGATDDDIEQAVLIADTLGELQAWYSFALASFVGGSLIERGGHNVLEAARGGCPIVVGPHTFNFEDIVGSMRDAQALHVAADASEVISFFQRVIEAPDEFEDMRYKALEEVNRQADVLDEYLHLLLPDTV